MKLELRNKEINHQKLVFGKKLCRVIFTHPCREKKNDLQKLSFQKLSIKSNVSLNYASQEKNNWQHELKKPQMH